MRKFLLYIPLLIATSFPQGTIAQEKLQMKGTEITGNKELPRVLYIVPWKSIERFEIETPQIVSVMEQQLRPVERASFRRTVQYHDALLLKAKAESTQPQNNDSGDSRDE